LKMAIYLCTADDIAKYNCPVCDTFECYTKGCGVWSNWNSTSEFYWNGTQCFEKMYRECNSTYGTCEGPTEKFDVALNNDECVLYKQPCENTTPLIIPSKSLTCPTQIVPTTIYKTKSVSPDVSVTSVYKTITVTVSASQTKCKTSTEYQKTTVIDVKTTTKVKTTTTTVTVQGPAPPAKFIDIEYDKKFYITVSAAIIGSILVGIFVLHAIVSYCEGNRIRRKVVSYAVVEDSGNTSRVEFVKETS